MRSAPRLVAALGALALASVGCGILGGSSTTIGDQKDLIAIVQRISLLPGVDALDPGGPTAIGTDWRTVVVTFTEPIAQSEVNQFSPSCSFVHPGLTVDPAAPIGFNTSPIGLIPPRTQWTVKFKAMAAGDYTLTLKSGVDGCSTLASDAGTTFVGTLAIRVSVVVSDGENPYIVTFRPNTSGLADDVDPALWFVAAGKLPMGSDVAPHAPITVTFSQRVRTPTPVDIEPTVSGFAVGNISAPIPDGVELLPDDEIISFDDSVDGHVTGREATILRSQTPSGMDLDADYTFRFHGVAPLTSYQSFVRDRSGLGLAMRLAGGPRDIPTTDTRAFHTAPVRIDSPVLGSYVNAADVASGGFALPVSGTLADRVDRVDLGLRSPDGLTSISFGPASRIVVDAKNALGVAIDQFSGTAVISRSLADGQYLLTAAASTGGQSAGDDEITIVKDTVPPSILAGGDATALADEAAIPDFCVDGDLDTVEAKVVFDGVAIASTSTWSTVLVNNFAQARQFCFSGVTLPSAAAIGTNQWTIVLTDAAGNTSSSTRQLVLRPVLLSAAPNPANPGDIVTIQAVGLGRLVDSDSVLLGPSPVKLGHGIFATNSGAAILAAVSGGTAATDVTTVVIRVPYFAASGAIAFAIAGTTSPPLSLGICTARPGPFVTDVTQDTTAGTSPFASDPFAGAVAMTGVLAAPGANLTPAAAIPFPTISPPPTASPTPIDVTSGGHPIIFTMHAGDGAIDARELQNDVPDAVSDRWSISTVSDVGPFANGIAAAQGPDGDARVAWVRETSAPPSATGVLQVDWQLVLAHRALANGAVTWRSAVLADHLVEKYVPGTANPSVLVDPPSTAIALAYAADGRGAAVYSAPVLPIEPTMGLWATFFDAAGNTSSVLLDGREGAVGAVSAAFDSAGMLWVAYSPDQAHAGATTTIEVVEVVRLFQSYREIRLRSPGHGIAPSIAADPSGAGIDVLFRSASPTAVGAPVVATWNGAWMTTTLPDPEGSVPLAGSAANLNLRSPQTSLRFGPDGSLRAGWASAAGSVHLATRTAASLLHAPEWRDDLLEVVPGAGPTFGMVLDGLGTARILYTESSPAAIRYYREEDNRALTPGDLPAPACSSQDYRRNVFPLDVGDVLAAHDTVDFTIAKLPDLGDPAKTSTFDLYVSALADNGKRSVRLYADPKVQTFELDSTDSSDDFTRIEAAYFLSPRSGTTPAIRLRAHTTLFQDRDYVFTVANDGDAEAIVDCCVPSDVPGAACNPVTPCILPSTICTGAPCTTSNGLGGTLSGLQGTLPLLTAGQDVSTSDYDASVASLDLRLRGIDLTAVPEVGGPGTLRLDLPLTHFEANLDVASVSSLEPACGHFGLRISSSGADKFRVDGPAAFLSRNGSSRYGVPSIGVPGAALLIPSGSINTSIRDSNPACTALIQTALDAVHFEAKLSSSLGAPTGDLATAIADPSVKLTGALLTPLLEAILNASPAPGAVDARRGVALRVIPDGSLEAVYEKPLPPSP